jgi:hypothetical protein
VNVSRWFLRLFLSSYLISKCVFPTCCWCWPIDGTKHETCSKLYSCELWWLISGLCQALPNVVKKFCILIRWLRKQSVPFCKLPASECKVCLRPQIINSLVRYYWIEWLSSCWIIKDSEILWYSLILHAQACLKLIFRVTCWLVICLIVCSSQNSIQMGRTFLCEAGSHLEFLIEANNFHSLNWFIQVINAYILLRVCV